MDIFKKLIFLIQKPCVIVVAGNERFLVADIIFQIFKSKFKTRKISGNIFPLALNKNEILIFPVDLVNFKNSEDYKYLLNKSSLPIFLLSGLGETPSENDERQTILEQVSEMARFLPQYGSAIINLEEGITRRIKSGTTARVLTYGFQEGADFLITDVNINGEGANFKINYEGDIVPFWIRGFLQKTQICDIVSAISVAAAKGLNLVEISQVLKDINFSQNSLI